MLFLSQIIDNTYKLIWNHNNYILIQDDITASLELIYQHITKITIRSLTYQPLLIGLVL